MRLVEIVVEVGPDGKLIGGEPDLPEPDPALFGPCPSCGRRHKAKVVEFITEETS